MEELTEKEILDKINNQIPIRNVRCQEGRLRIIQQHLNELGNIELNNLHVDHLFISGMSSDLTLIECSIDKISINHVSNKLINVNSTKVDELEFRNTKTDFVYLDITKDNTRLLQFVKNEFNKCVVRHYRLSRFYLLGNSIDQLNIGVSLIQTLFIDQTRIESNQRYDIVANIDDIRIQSIHNIGIVFVQGKSDRSQHLVKELFIKNSICGNLTLSNLNFSRVSLFKLDKSVTGDLMLFNVSLSNDIRAYQQSNKDPDQTLNQLQLILEHMGYKSDYEKIHRLYLQARLNAAIESGDKPQILSLGFHKWSSNYGSDWLWALSITFTLGVLFYSLILFLGWASGVLIYDSASISLTVGEFFNWMNPIRKIYDFPGLERLSLPMIIVDFVGRVFILAMYYQVVAAFRFYAKK
ncbi:MAG: hypothetical protein AAGA64_13035 [Bacteroidota bacterium]